MPRSSRCSPSRPSALQFDTIAGPLGTHPFHVAVSSGSYFFGTTVTPAIAGLVIDHVGVATSPVSNLISATQATRIAF